MFSAGSASQLETAKFIPTCCSSPLALAAVSRSEAAAYWFRFGFDVIPVVPGTKRTAVAWDPWLAGLSSESIARHWSRFPDHDVGFIAGGDHIVLDADSAEAVAALEAIEARFGLTSQLAVKTSKGRHHHFRLAEGTVARVSTHCTVKHPHRLDSLTGRRMVVLPPSGSRCIVTIDAGLERASQISTVNQAFIDAVFAHNDQPPPSQVEQAASPRIAAAGAPLPLLRAVLQFLDPDVAYALVARWRRAIQRDARRRRGVRTFRRVEFHRPQVSRHR